MALHKVGERGAVHERRRRQQDEDVDPAQVLCTVGCASGHVTWHATGVLANAVHGMGQAGPATDMQERTLNRPMIFLLQTVEQRKSCAHSF